MAKPRLRTIKSTRPLSCEITVLRGGSLTAHADAEEFGCLSRLTANRPGGRVLFRTNRECREVEWPCRSVPCAAIFTLASIVAKERGRIIRQMPELIVS